jgi:putative glutamine amidotransferase
MTAPLVGLTTDSADAPTDGHPVQPCAAVPERYLEAVADGGGRPILLPPSTGPPDGVLDAVDAIVVIGGADVDPATYGQVTSVPHPGASPRRDRAELALVRDALRRGMPVLGVCRGSEILNIAHSGTVVGDLGERAPDHAGRGGGFGEHRVHVEDGSRLAAIVGTSLLVHTYHHSGIGRIGAGLRAVAHAEDGTVEAVEATGGPFALGVLWHPEMADRRPLFAALVAAAGHRAAGK